MVFPSLLVSTIQCIPISHFGVLETLIWPFMKQSYFSVMSCYNALIEDLEDGAGGSASSYSNLSYKFLKKTVAVGYSS